jgi:hypothetical protein
LWRFSLTEFSTSLAIPKCIRWLGNRKQIETMTTVWDSDRTADLRDWVKLYRQIFADAYVFDWLNRGPRRREWFFERANENCGIVA